MPRLDGLTGVSLAGGRLTSDDGSLTFGRGFTIMAPAAHEDNWRLLNLDRQTLSTLDPHTILDMLADLQPGYSRALWDFQRLGNPGFELTAYAVGSDAPHPAGQRALDDFADDLTELYGSIDVVLNRLFFSTFHRGAVFAELVLDRDGRQPIDLATPDPKTIRFRRFKDDLRGTVWQAGQYQGAKWVVFDRPTIRYVPIDPFPGSPYGRPLGSPALFTSLFLLGLLHDLRRVIAQQGWPRHEIVVLLEKLKASIPTSIQNDPVKVREWADSIILEVQAAYGALEPDDAWVHTDVVQMNKPQGAVDSSSLGGVDGVIAMLERSLVQALKTMPLMLGMTEGTSEANANRQWEIHAAGIKAVQHLIETPISRLLSLALQAQGIPARAQLTFAELRASEMFRDEQTRQLRNTNIAFERDQGWRDQDEAAQEAVGHEPVEDAPTASTPVEPLPEGEDTDTNPEPGESREPRPLRIVGG
jgi:hypothetical protein